MWSPKCQGDFKIWFLTFWVKLVLCFVFKTHHAPKGPHFSNMTVSLFVLLLIFKSFIGSFIVLISYFVNIADTHLPKHSYKLTQYLKRRNWKMSLYFDRKYGKRESMRIMRMLVADVGVGLAQKCCWAGWELDGQPGGKLVNYFHWAFLLLSLLHSSPHYCYNTVEWWRSCIFFTYGIFFLISTLFHLMMHRHCTCNNFSFCWHLYNLMLFNLNADPWEGQADIWSSNSDRCAREQPGRFLLPFEVNKLSKSYKSSATFLAIVFLIFYLKCADLF